MRKTVNCIVLFTSRSEISCGRVSIQTRRNARMLHHNHTKAGVGSRLGSIKEAEMSTRKEYLETIIKLNQLQSNAANIALSKQRHPEQILPKFAQQLELAQLKLDDLDRLKIIHVGGTKGKGSTCAFVESILRHSGRKTGFYNSPHLVKVNERIRINGQPIDEAAFSRYFHEVHSRLQTNSRRAGVQMPGYFSFLTILAFHIFIQERVECVVLEVGIGGEYDPTNIIRQPVVCGITTLDYDHTNILGTTIKQIAWTKAGICKPGVPLMTVEHDHDEAIETIRARAREKDSPVYVCEPLLAPENFKLGIEGFAQKTNASLAYQLAKFFIQTCQSDVTQYKPSSNQLHSSIADMEPFERKALAECSWPGRCQTRQLPGAVFFLDGAHTTKSMRNCLDWFLNRSKLLNPTAPRVLLVNVIGERSKRDVLAPLTEGEYFSDVIFSPNRLHSQEDSLAFENFVGNPTLTSDKSIENAQLNAQVWSELVEDRAIAACPVRVFKDTFTCFDYIEGLVESSGEHHVLVTGSLHFVGAILETLDSRQLCDTNEHPRDETK